MLLADRPLTATFCKEDGKITATISFASGRAVCPPVKDLADEDTLQTLEDRLKDSLDAGVTNFTFFDGQEVVDKACQLAAVCTGKDLTVNADDDGFGICRKILVAMKNQVFLPNTNLYDESWSLETVPKAYQKKSSGISLIKVRHR